MQRSLRTIGRQSRRDQKETERVDLALRKMESAALEAYRKDIEGNANVDLSSKAIKEQMEQKSSTVWHEAKSKEGKTYYWNTETNEKTWEAPSCGYLTLKQQDSEAFRIGKKQLEARDKHQKTVDMIRSARFFHRNSESVRDGNVP